MEARLRVRYGNKQARGWGYDTLGLHASLESIWFSGVRILDSGELLGKLKGPSKKDSIRRPSKVILSDASGGKLYLILVHIWCRVAPHDASSGIKTQSKIVYLALACVNQKSGAV